MTHHRPALFTVGIVLVGMVFGRTSAAEPASELLAPDVSVRVETANADGPWKLVVTNRSAASLRFAADGRLLRLEVRTEEEQKKKKKGGPTTCRLPAGLRPSGVAEDRSVVLAPGARYEETFAPLLYCFAEKERAALAPGTKLVPILGFDVPDAKPRAKPKPPVSPFVTEDAAPVASVAPVKAIVGEPFTVPEAPRPPPAAEPARASSADAGAANLVVTTPARLEAAEASSIDLTVTVTNRGKLPATVRLRRDLFTFEVNGPNGPFRCGSTPGQRTIPRDLYDALRGGAAQSLSVRLVEPCPDDTFSRPGLYTIRARLVANTTLEKTPGVRPWTGEATATKTTLLRVRTGDSSYYRSPPVVITAKEGG
jgi:hypothetical protein